MTKAKVTFPGSTPYALDVEDEGINVVSNPDPLNFTGPGTVTIIQDPYA